jgi:hypothetical protein
MADAQDDWSTGDHGSRRLGLPDQLSAACAMIPLIEGREFGWSNGWILAAITLPVSAFPFVIIERKSKLPMLPLFLFSDVFSWIVFTVQSGPAALFWHAVRAEPLFS